MTLRLAARLALILLFAISGVAQESAQSPQPKSAIPSTGFAGLDQYRASRIAIFTDDFGQLARYREANAALKPSAPGENRVVFFGDSITDIWHLDEYFSGKAYINRGIGGQTTPQMLVRFPAGRDRSASESCDHSCRHERHCREHRSDAN